MCSFKLWLSVSSNLPHIGHSSNGIDSSEEDTRSLLVGLDDAFLLGGDEGPDLDDAGLGGTDTWRAVFEEGAAAPAFELGFIC